MIKNDILSDIALALTDHETAEYGSSHFVDLTTGDIIFIQSDYMFEADEITEEEIISYSEWEQDEIRTYLTHDLICIDPISSNESYRIMEAFTESRSEKEQMRLFRALSGKRPFAVFRIVVEELGILDQWYDFKNQAEARMAEEWLSDNELEIKDGKVVRTDSLQQDDDDI